MEILYADRRIVLCLKPAGAASVDQPGGVPDLLRQELGDENACVRTVHRLDQVVGGVMVLARSRQAASLLSLQVREREFQKEYLAVLDGELPEDSGTLRDLLGYSRQERRAYAADIPGPEVREAVLDYQTLARQGGRTLVGIVLHTGRTHQIRVQFSLRGFPVTGDEKYGGSPRQGEGIALWSYRLTFRHPQTGEVMTCSAPPPAVFPWTEFKGQKELLVQAKITGIEDIRP
jgi:23S rRNA pseudouridine1911/1915/1917 synthase